MFEMYIRCVILFSFLVVTPNDTVTLKSEIYDEILQDSIESLFLHLSPLRVSEI